MFEPEGRLGFTKLIDHAVDFGVRVNSPPTNLETCPFQNADKFSLVVRNHGAEELAANAYVRSGHFFAFWEG